MKLRHALFIAFHYPPEASSSGVLRTLKYSRFLGEFGWRVSVIAPESDASDFRDPGIEDPPEPGTPNGAVYRTINRWLERDVVRRSAAVVASTAHLRDLLRDRYRDDAGDKFHYIANGYDEADFAALPSSGV